MPIKDLILALSKSKLASKSSLIAQLWKSDQSIPEPVFNLILNALESSSDENTEVIHALLSECESRFCMDYQDGEIIIGR